MLEEDSAKK